MKATTLELIHMNLYPLEVIAITQKAMRKKKKKKKGHQQMRGDNKIKTHKCLHTLKNGLAL